MGRRCLSRPPSLSCLPICCSSGRMRWANMCSTAQGHSNGWSPLCACKEFAHHWVFLEKQKRLCSLFLSVVHVVFSFTVVTRDRESVQLVQCLLLCTCSSQQRFFHSRHGVLWGQKHCRFLYCCFAVTQQFQGSDCNPKLLSRMFACKRTSGRADCCSTAASVCNQ